MGIFPPFDRNTLHFIIVVVFSTSFVDTTFTSFSQWAFKATGSCSESSYLKILLCASLLSAERETDWTGTTDGKDDEKYLIKKEAKQYKQCEDFKT